jgi:membrane fusion protein (multidrug efflux system)
MKKNIVAASALAGLVIVGLGGYWLGKREGSAVPGTGPAATGTKAGMPSPANAVLVETAKIQTSRLAQAITAVGSLRSDESITIRPEVSGRISDIGVAEGQRVTKGSLLIRFDAAVQRAELQQAEANLALAKSRLDRARDLFTKNFISAQARDDAESNFQVAQATHDLAQARMTKLEIRAPFSGLVGLRQVSVGDYVKDGQDIANLEAIDPLKVDFRVPEIYMKQVAAGQAMQIALDAFPAQTFSGRVFAINPLVDANGRSIVVRAIVNNADARLRPGMFARVRLLTSDSRESMTIPEQALVPAGDDFYVFKVAEGKAIRTKVEIGQRQTGIVEITDGLANSDVVVTAGQIKIRDGSSVKATEPTAGAATAREDAKPGDGKPVPASRKS